MEKIDLINTFVKMFLITFFIYLTYEKITNYKNRNIRYLGILLVSIIISCTYIIINRYLPPVVTVIILYIIYGIIINKFIENNINYVAYLFSCAISYAIYLITIFISGIIVLLLLDQIEYANPVSLITIPIIFTLLFIFIFTRKRFKNGFNFLKNREINNKIRMFGIFFIGVVIIIFSFLIEMDHIILASCVVIGTLFILSSISVLIKKQITKTYKNKMRDRTIEIQKTEIDEQTRIIEEIKEENLKLAKAIHKYNKKFSSLEFAMKKALELESKTEFANEISVILKETKETSENFAKSVEVITQKLPLTNIIGIDNMFKYMQDEAEHKNINFNLKVNTNINPLLETIISKDKFETLIGDHLKDAIIAVDVSKASYKSILVTLGIVEGIYELSIYDTGVEFEIETLLKLGKEQVTTYKETGGSGIGFMTTFETLRECKASLVIEEYSPETTNYTKSVTIRFDERNEYKIISYRADKIKEQTHEHRIIVQKLK